MTKQKHHKGFTLVELLIAISLIAILSGVLFSVINPMGIQKKARDSQRVSDLAKIKVALENYFADNRAYPVKSDAWGIVNNTSPTLRVLRTGSYINVIPVDPKETGACNVAGALGYYYKTNATGSLYVLSTYFETTPPVTTCQSGVDCTGCNTTSVYYAKAD